MKRPWRDLVMARYNAERCVVCGWWPTTSAMVSAGQHYERVCHVCMQWYWIAVSGHGIKRPPNDLWIKLN